MSSWMEVHGKEWRLNQDIEKEAVQTFFIFKEILLDSLCIFFAMLSQYPGRYRTDGANGRGDKGYGHSSKDEQ